MEPFWPLCASCRIVISSFFSISYVAEAKSQSNPRAARLCSALAHIHAASRRRWRTIGIVVAQHRAEDRQQLAFDMFARQCLSCEEKLYDGTFDVDFHDIKESSEATESDHCAIATSAGLKGRKMACRSPKIFFQILSSLPRNLARQSGNVEVRLAAAARIRPGSARHCRFGSAGRPRRRAVGSYAGPFPAIARRPGR